MWMKTSFRKLHVSFALFVGYAYRKDIVGLLRKFFNFLQRIEFPGSD